MRSVSGVESWSVSEVESWSVSEVELTIRIEDFHTDSILLTQNHRRRIERMKKKLKELLVYEQPGKYIVKTENYSDEYVTPVLTAGKSFVLGYTDEKEGIFYGTKEPVIIFDDFTRDTKYVDFDFKVKSSAMKILHKCNKEDSLKYFHYAINSIKYTPFSHKRLWISDFSNFEVEYPTSEKQHEIANRLDKIQSAIDNKKQQLSLLDEAVKSKFNELIIENGEWKKEKLGEISESILGKMLDKSKHGDEKKFPYLANFNVKWFDFDLSELNEMPFSEKEMEKFQLKIGDILMCEGGEIGRCAVWNNELQNCYFQKALHRIRVNYDFLNPTYLVHWFKLKCDTNSFDDLVGKGATFKHLTGEKLKTIEVPVPPLSLQNRFANFVQQIDKAKSIAKQQLADLQELLDSKMQQYFA